MASSPQKNADGPVSIEITSNGSPIPDSFSVYSVRTRSELNRVAEAIVVLADGDPASQEFAVADGNEFKPGSEIEICAGYANRTDTIFVGIVTAMRLRISADQGARVEVQCRHQAAVLLQGRRRTVYPANKKDSELINEVLSNAGISAVVDSSGIALPETPRIDVTDWDFIVSRAENNGMVAFCDADSVKVTKPDFSARAELEVTYGADLIALDIETSGSEQYAGYSASAWDPAAQKLNTEKTSADSKNKLGSLSASALAKVLKPQALANSSSAFHEPTALSGFTSSRAMRADLASTIGTVSFQGSAKAKLNTTLKLSGLAEYYNGSGLIAGVLHRIEAGSWTTEVQLGMDCRWRAERAGFAAADAAAVSTPVRGLVIAKVVKLDGDPDGLGRIQVSVPEFDDAATPLWVRLGIAYATSSAGMMFLPEIDDELVLGFLNNDPANPVVLGALHNPKAKPPADFVDYDPDNNTKAIVSREQISVVFDEEKKILTLSTPAGNQIALDDDGKQIVLTDQHGNTTTMDGGGISCDSSSDIKINASGNIEISAGGDLKMSATEVAASGSSAFKANGGGSAELTAGGTTKVAGAMVQIN